MQSRNEHLQSNEVFFEAQIENLTAAPICMERCTLEPSELYKVSEMSTSDGGRSLVPSALAPHDVCQYLYRLSATRSDDDRLYRGVTTIGKLDMVWRSAMGERGRLQTSALQRMAPGCGDIRCAVIAAPWTTTVAQLVPIRLRLTNCCTAQSERTLDLTLVLEDGHAPGLLWANSISGLRLGTLAPQQSLEHIIYVVPVSCDTRCHTDCRSPPACTRSPACASPTRSPVASTSSTKWRRSSSCDSSA